MRLPCVPALLVAVLPALSSCSGVGDIDRTQPNKLDKALLSGEWLYQQTVIDAPYTTGFTFIGEQSERTERLRWDVQENFLVGYRSYALVDGGDVADHVDGTTGGRGVLAVFPILGHFDVQREYNSATGEQTNVIVENAVDHPWYERRYMRVDWSQNLAPSFDFLVGQVQQVPGAHFVQKPGDPEAMVFAERNADGTWREQTVDSSLALTSLDYFDAVHRVFAAPETFALEDWDGSVYDMPACWVYAWLGTQAADCAPAEITIRSAFLRVHDTGYVPLSYPDNEILRDDNGDPIRVDYVDRDSLEPSPDGFIARAPYFDKFGFFRSEREAYDARHGETRAGQVFLINRYALWEDEADCVDPTARVSHAACTVKPIVYYTSPGFPADLRPEAQRTIDEWNTAFRRVVNELKHGGTRSLEDVEDVVILRDNTFAIDAAGVVVDRGQRLGDLRFSMLGYVQNPNGAGLLGYGPSVADPVTGEIVQSSAFQYAAGIEQLAQLGKDVVDYTNDPDRFELVIDGEDVATDVVARRNSRAAVPGPDEARRFARERGNSARAQAIRALGRDQFRRDGGERRARLAAIEGTALAERLATDRLIRAARVAAGEEVHLDDVRGGTSLSPRAWALGAAAHRDKVRRQLLEKRSVTHARFFDTSVVAIAEELKALPAEERYQELRRRIFVSTALHEVGHTLGLRHNFEASTDALNYGRTYWDIKGTGAEPLELPDDAQLAAGLRNHQYASIMDYGSRFMSDLAGLGLYDHAAIAFGYGQLVEVFAREPDENLLEAFDLPTAVRKRHYTRLPATFGGIDGMHDRRLVPYVDVVAQLKGEAPWSLWEVPYRFCSDEYDGATATCATFDEGADAFEIAEAARRRYVEYFPFLSFSRDKRMFNEWDYMVGIQERTFLPMLTQYQNWVFQSFVDEYFYDCLVGDDEDAGCDFADGPDAAHFGLEAVPWTESADGGLPGAAATRLLLDLLGEVIAQPEPGSYAFDAIEGAQLLYAYEEDSLCPPGPAGDDCSAVNVPLGEGRYTESVWDTASGYHFYDRLQMVGSFYDKLVALETAVTSDTYFLGVDAGADVGTFAIGLSLLFPEEIHRLVGGIAAQDYGQFAGVTCDETRTYVPPRLSDTNPSPCANAGTATIVDPATSFTVELYAIWYGMAFLPLGFDLDFNDRMKIWLDGSGEDIDVADESMQVTFANPLNNRVYQATRAGDAATYAPAAALLERAQRFADAWVADPSLENRYRLENIAMTIEDVRGTYALYGSFAF